MITWDDAEACPDCASSGRSWPVQRDQAFCGLCGFEVRKVEFVDFPRVVKGRAVPWYVADGAQGRIAQLTIRSVGPLTATIERFGNATGTGTGDAPYLARPVTLAFGETCTLGLEVPADGGPTQFRLEVSGNFVQLQRAVQIRLAPAEVKVRIPLDDPLARFVSQKTGRPVERAGKLDVSGERITWKCPAVALLPWPSTGECEIDILPSQGAPFPAATVRDAIRWEGERRVVVTGVADDPGKLRVRLRVADAPLKAPLQGRLVFDLKAIGRPTLVAEVRFDPGRPERDVRLPDLAYVEPGQPIDLPLDIQSRIEVAVLGWRQGDVQKDVSEVLPKGPGTPIEVQCATRGGAVQVRAQPALAGGSWPWHVELRPVRTGRSEVEIRVLMRIPEIDPKAPVQVAPTTTIAVEGRAVAYWKRPKRLVCDFGTSFTCAVLHDKSEEPHEALALRGADRGEVAHQLPTVVYLEPVSGACEPRVAIGREALFEDRTGVRAGGRLVRHFKTKIGDPSWRVAIPSAGSADGLLQLDAADLTERFMRELFLDIRRRSRNEPIGELYVTCPTTFTPDQRSRLEAALARLRAYGVLEDPRVLIDEASAAAFGDVFAEVAALDRPRGLHALVVDIGGGTSDIAVIEVRPVSDSMGPTTYRLVPRGVTGMRDFGGSNVTSAIASILAEEIERLQPCLRRGQNGIPVRPIHGVDDPDLATAVAGNRAWLDDVAETLKTGFYGRWRGPAGESYSEGDTIRPPVGPDWYARLDPRVAPKDPSQFLMGMLPLRAVTWEALGGERVSIKVTDSKQKDIENLFEKLNLKRATIDARILEAVDEIFDRAARLWASVRTGDARTPDLVIFAGNSAALPLVWKRCEEKLGVSSAQIRFSISRAKRKVVEGAALYRYLRDFGMRAGNTADLRVELEEPHRYVLMPVVVRLARAFEGIFRAGQSVTDLEAREYETGATGQIALTVFQDVDYRAAPASGPAVWQPTAAMRALGISALGKESIGQFVHACGPRERVRVEFTIDGEGYHRWLVVKVDGREIGRELL